MSGEVKSLDRTEADHWKAQLTALCDLIIERTTLEETSTHIVCSISDDDAMWISTRAERMKAEMETTRFARLNVFPPSNLPPQERSEQTSPNGET